MTDDIAREDPPEANAPAPHKGPPKPGKGAKSVYLYRLDEETQKPVIIGRVFVDTHGDAWVRINSEDLAAGIGVENIDGVALLDKYTFYSLEE